MSRKEASRKFLLTDKMMRAVNTICKSTNRSLTGKTELGPGLENAGFEDPQCFITFMRALETIHKAIEALESNGIPENVLEKLKEGEQNLTEQISKSSLYEQARSIAEEEITTQHSENEIPPSVHQTHRWIAKCDKPATHIINKTSTDSIGGACLILIKIGANTDAILLIKKGLDLFSEYVEKEIAK